MTSTTGRTAAVSALAHCGRACRLSSNGHGRRWARARCAAALVADGTPPAIAEDCAAAMDRLAQGLQAVVERVGPVGVGA